MEFSAPATNEVGPRPADLQGHLLIISPKDYREGIQTVNGDADAVSVDLIDLDSGESHNDVLFFNIALRNALRPKIGQKVLARISQGIAKPGKTAPWILIDATTDAADVERAKTALAKGPQAPAAKAVVADGAVPPEVAALLAQLGGKIVSS